LPEPWAGDVEASLRLIDELDREIDACEQQLKRLRADHRYVPLLTTIPGIAWVLAYTIAAEIGDISRFPTPRQAGRLHRPLPRASTNPATATAAARSQRTAPATCAGR
jgi:transposase